MKKVFAFIFVRGGSKGLPKKNLLSFGGKPLFVHAIELAKQINEIDRIFVSTDSKEIISIAKEYEVEIISRPKELAADNSPEIEAWRHAISFLKDQGEEDYIFLSLPATSPLRNSLDISRCLEALDDRTDGVITVTPASRNPYFNMVSRDNNGLSSILLSSDSHFRRQDAPLVYDMTTVAYVSRPKFVLENDSLFAGVVKSVIIPKERAIDIDDYLDFKFAELLLEKE